MQIDRREALISMSALMVTPWLSQLAHATGPAKRRVTILLFDGVTVLDAVGPYELLHRVPELEVNFVAEKKGLITADSGELRLIAEQSLTDVLETSILIVPGGGIGVRKVRENQRVMEWIKAIDQTTTYTASVCTGSLILAGAGLLRSRDATTHWALKDMLSEFGVQYRAERYVRSGKYWTSAGVSAGIDMTLAMIGEMYGANEAQIQQLGLQYDPDPPFDSGSDQKAPPEIVEAFLARRRR